MKIKLLPSLIFLTLISAPLYLIRCKNFSWCTSPVPFTFLEILILLTFSVWIFQKYTKKRNIKKILVEIRHKIPPIVQILMIVFLVFPAIFMVFSPINLSSLGFYKAYFVEPFLFFIVVLDYLSEKKSFKLIFWALMSSSIWISLLSILEKAINYSPFNYAEFVSRGRVGGIYTTSNAVGLLVGPLVVVLLSYIFYLIYEKKAKVVLGFNEITLALGSLVTLIAGIVVSGSRGAILGVVASAVFFFGFILYKKIPQKIVKNAIKIIFSALVIFFFLFNILFLFNISFVIKQGNNLQFFSQLKPRFCLWEGAIKIIEDKPIAGSGLGGYLIDNPKYQTCSTEKQPYPHNIFLNFWAETGIFGLISFILLCSWFFFKLLIGEKINYLRVGFASFFISILFHGLVDIPYFKNDLAFVFWTVLAISLYLINEINLFIVRVRRG